MTIAWCRGRRIGTRRRIHRLSLFLLSGEVLLIERRCTGLDDRLRGKSEHWRLCCPHNRRKQQPLSLFIHVYLKPQSLIDPGRKWWGYMAIMWSSRLLWVRPIQFRSFRSAVGRREGVCEVIWRIHHHRITILFYTRAITDCTDAYNKIKKEGKSQENKAYTWKFSPDLRKRNQAQHLLHRLDLSHEAGHRINCRWTWNRPRWNQSLLWYWLKMSLRTEILRTLKAVREKLPQFNSYFCATMTTRTLSDWTESLLSTRH